MSYAPDILDINMGCPVPKVVNNNSGSALMKDIDRAAEIVKSSKKRFGSTCNGKNSVRAGIRIPLTLWNLPLLWNRQALTLLQSTAEPKTKCTREKPTGTL